MPSEPFKDNYSFYKRVSAYVNGKSNFYDAGSYDAYNFNVDFVSLLVLRLLRCRGHNFRSLWILSVMKVGNSTFI